MWWWAVKVEVVEEMVRVLPLKKQHHALGSALLVVPHVNVVALAPSLKLRRRGRKWSCLPSTWSFCLLNIRHRSGSPWSQAKCCTRQRL